MRKLTRDEIKAKLTAVIRELRNAGRASDEIAAAVLDLCGPKPLVWAETSPGFYRADILRGCYKVYGKDGDWRAVLMAYCVGYNVTRGEKTPEAAQAAAQAHADAAHWANTRMGDA